MTMWVLFSILGFLVFGFPLIDEIHRRRMRRMATIPARDVAYRAPRE
jgi:hypothetical protein